MKDMVQVTALQDMSVQVIFLPYSGLSEEIARCAKNCIRNRDQAPQVLNIRHTAGYTKKALLTTTRLSTTKFQACQGHQTTNSHH
jgi:hypothetical protein